MAIPTSPNPRPYPTSPTLRVHLRYTVGTDTDVLPGFYIEYAGTKPLTTDLNQYAGHIASVWQTNIAGMTPIPYTLNGVTVIDITNNTGAEGLWSGSYPGQAAGNYLAAGSSTNINFAVARRYRGGKPRICLPAGVQADLATPQTWTTAYQNSAKGFWDSFIAAVTTGAWTGATNLQQVNVPWYSGVWEGVDSKGRTQYRPNYRNPMIDNDPIIATSTMPRVGSQRNRNKGAG